MASAPWMKFYPRDWRGDQALRAVSMAARGLWMECLCIMHEAKPYGHLLINGEPVEDDVLARMVGAPVDEVRTLMSELRKAGVLSVTRAGVAFSRRMMKDHAAAQKGAKAANKRWSQVTENKNINEPPNGLANGPPITQKPEARIQKEENIRPQASVVGRPERDATFGLFQKAYPRRDGSQDWPKAREIFDRAVRAGIDPKTIIGGAERYAADCRRRGDEGGKFVKQARSWLNGRLWEEYSGQELFPAPEAAGKPDGWPARLPDPETCFSAWRRGSWPPTWGFPPGDPDCPLPPAIVSDWQRRRDQAA